MSMAYVVVHGRISLTTMHFDTRMDKWSQAKCKVSDEIIYQLLTLAWIEIKPCLWKGPPV